MYHLLLEDQNTPWFFICLSWIPSDRTILGTMSMDLKKTQASFLNNIKCLLL